MFGKVVIFSFKHDFEQTFYSVLLFRQQQDSPHDLKISVLNKPFVMLINLYADLKVTLDMAIWLRLIACVD